MTKINKISIGLDLSLVGTGVVVINNGLIVRQDLIKSKPIGSLAIDELRRILRIVRQIEEVVIEFNPNIVVIENLAFMARNTTALTQLAGLNYFVRDIAFRNKIPFVLCAPTTLKKFATGKGNCPKDNIMMEVYKRWHVTITNNNISDAFILAKMGQALLGKVEKLTKPQLETINLLQKQYEDD
jgi:crossover junction endodeoxyribonuclease RuvC